jgi:hypothetical protein
MAGGARRLRARRTIAALTLSLACVALSGCGGEDGPGAVKEPEAPVGTPVLPDLAPTPQRNVVTKLVGGHRIISFNTIITNVGKGDFVLRAERDVRGGWTAEQDIPYSEAGARRVRIAAPLVWGGDGHSHWHIERVASVWLEPLDAKGAQREGVKRRYATKIGFCFYDHTHQLARGPEKPQYSARSCGKKDYDTVGMGLSPGWNDTYLMSLPGQTIEVTGLKDGLYRLVTDIDEKGWFRERTRANNLTWIDLKITTTNDGFVAVKVDDGPVPA